jgi:benzoylformate decarboxylase
VLALHEASAVGMATGHALASGEPALVVLHTTAGLGNAVSALATARANRAPLVVVVGQQDRRHLALEPFLAGDLLGLAGDYPVWTHQPVLACDVPGAIARAWHEAGTGRGPAVVVVPMDDWGRAADAEEVTAPAELHRAVAPAPVAVEAVVALVSAARRPLLVVGAGLDSPAGWKAAVDVAEHLRCPVRQEAFGARAGFPQDHPRFAGHLPAGRSELRAVLADHDVVLVLGAPVLRQYPFEEGRLVPEAIRVAVVSDDADEVHRSPADVAVLADPAVVAEQVARRLAAQATTAAAREVVDGTGREAASLDRTGGRTSAEARTPERGADRLPPAPGSPLMPGHVLSALGARLPREAVVVEETPSSRHQLHEQVPALAPMGFLSAAMGGLGFALPASIGVRMAQPRRPVVAVLGDGSSLYAVQGLWSAAHYGVGVLFVVLANGGYAIMDRLAAAQGGGSAPWPAFAELSVARIAEGFGCSTAVASTHEDLIRILDDVVPSLADRTEPLLLEVAVGTYVTAGA